MAITAIDTSVAVPLLVTSHSQHGMVAEWAKSRNLGLSGHALAETYSVLTRLPGDARVEPADAVALIDENFPETLQWGVRSARPRIVNSRSGASPVGQPMTDLSPWRPVSTVRCWSPGMRVPGPPTSHSG